MRKKPALLTKVMDKMEDYEKAGIFVINTPVQTYNDLSSCGLMSIDPLESASFYGNSLRLPEF